MLRRVWGEENLSECRFLLSFLVFFFSVQHFISIISKHLQKVGFHLCQIWGADLGSHYFLHCLDPIYVYISISLYILHISISLYALLCFNPVSLPLNLGSPRASAPVSFQRSAAAWHSSLQAIQFSFPCLTKSVTIHPSAFPLPKFGGYLSSVWTEIQLKRLSLLFREKRTLL